MQCVNCKFNNMPGTQACARCGSSLTLSTSAIDVHPPRAGSIMLLMRRLLPIHLLYYSVRDRHATASRASMPLLETHLPEKALLARLIVPGWAQLHLGERWQGRMLLFIWLALLVLGLLNFGTSGGSILLGLSFSVHSFAASDIVNRASEDRGVAAQIGRSILISLILAGTLYGPGSFLITRVFDPVTLEYAAGPFASGDTMIVNRWATPTAGSVVLYNIPDYQGQARVNEGNVQRLGYSGQRIDRILAVAGDRIESRKGVLLVNGRVTKHASLVNQRLDDFPATPIPSDCVFIIPSTTKDLNHASDLGLLHQMCIVSTDQISGVVYARLHPLYRFRLIF